VPLNIKNVEVENLAAEVASIARETKTEAIRRALEERKARLMAGSGRPRSKQAMMRYLERMVWPRIPPAVRGKPLNKREREKILGYGPDGV
jgi:antitoxin VapB